MGTRVGLLSAVAMLVAAGTPLHNAVADETSSQDKLRILYSNRLNFTDSGIPLVTVEIMSGQSEVRISSRRGVLVRPDGDSGSEMQSGSNWTVRLADSTPAVLRDWIVAETFAPSALGHDRQVAQALDRWTGRGYTPQLFETGTVFGVSGEVIDSRQVLLAVASARPGQAAQKVRDIERAFHINARIHRELVRRAQGMVVAVSAHAVVRNPAVIWFAPASPGDTLSVEDVVVGGGGSQLQTRRETRHYAGSIYVAVGSDGKLTAVNAVSADKLLAGLVPAEMYPEAPDDALAAQAIAARTELLQKIGTRHLTDPYMLCSSQHCQVYSGAGHEHPRTTRAVRRTRGKVLLRPNGGLVDARYSASCGGHSEHNEHIWDDPPDPILRGHFDHASQATDTRLFVSGITSDNIEQFLSLPGSASYCGSTRYSKGRYRWTKRISATELSRRIATHYPQVGSVRAIEPLQRGISGRISKIRIRGTKGVATATGDLHIRRLLGGLRSTLFVINPVGDSTAPEAFEFRGAGFGHGVGMCQLGAIGMAQQGASYEAILRHYYPSSRIRRLY